MTRSCNSSGTSSRPATRFTRLTHGTFTTRWASADIAPAVGTGSAPEDEVQTLQLPLIVDPNAPADVYPIIVGLYSRDEAGNFNRLQVVQDGRITMADFVELTKVRIVGELAP